MKFKWLALLICIVVISNISAFAKLAWDDNEFISADQLHAGLQGYGKTVYEGTKVEKFDVEIIGVLHNVDINFDMILIKVLNGPVPDRKMQSVAGMSGSPIYINDKLIGAYAYGWNFQNEAIAGVTPIAAMLDSTEPGSSQQIAAGTYKPEKGLLKIGDKLITRVKIADNMTDASKLNAQADPTTMILSPVSTPLFVTGLPDSALKPLQAVFEKYNVRVMQGATMDGVGAGTTTLDPNAKLEAGSAVAVSLVEGDVNLSAVGTVTYVKDNTALCFGHPFMGLGKINFPMSAAYVHGIISSMQGSFKLASPCGRVGTAVSDRNFALAGTIGLEPDTIRAIMTLTDDSRKLKNNVTVDICNSQQFTPFILYSWLMLGGAGQLGNMQTDEGTYTADTVFMTDKLGTLRQHMVASPAAGGGMPMGDFMRLSDALINNPYEPVKINRLYLNLSYNPERNIAVIESVIPDRLVVKPGDTVNFDVKIRPYGKPTENTVISVKIPSNTIDSEMLVAIAGGTHGSMFKPLTVAPPVPDEGIAGIVRYLQSGSIAPNTLVAASLYPTLSYPHAGEYIRDLPIPLLETLMITDNGTGMIPQQSKKNSNKNQPNESNKGDDGVAMMMGDAVPTLYIKTEDSKYILAGGSIIPLTIVQKSIVNDGRNRGEISVMSPLLSSSISAPESNDNKHPQPGPDNEEDYYSTQLWMTAQHKDAYKRFVNALSTSLPAVNAPFSLPKYRKGAFVPARPLSATTMDDNNIEIDATPDKSSPDNAPSTPKKTGGKPAPGMMDEDMAGGDADNVKDGVLLTHKRPSWGLTSAADFLHGEHYGTSVTSKGALILSPGMRQLYNTGEMMPWRMAATADGIFVGGWRNNNLVKVNKEGAGETIFPKEDMPRVKAISAITSDAAGNILFSTWPDNIVRQIAADGTVKSKWEINSPIWDIAVTAKGKIYAASNNGSIYLLENDGDIVLICQLPDSHVYALAAGTDGNLYMVTAPQGKIYKLDNNDAVTAIANCKGTIASLAVDAKGNVYAGTANSCRVIKITPDGAQTIIMRGMSGINRHVLALKMQDGDIYAATGPAGGIYKIANPASSEPEVSVLYARSDERTGIDENEPLGSESVMVNALATGTDGKLLAAAAMPGQILQMQPRATGSFNSAVLTSPSVSTWGQFDAHIRSTDGQSVKIESRTGRTATPDLTWSNWSNIDLKSMVVDSNPSLYAQFRITLNSADKTSPALDYLKLYYTPTNSAPVVKLATPRTGEYLNGDVKLKWMGMDADGDDLIYCLYISKDDGTSWKLLTEGITADTSDKDMPMADEEMPTKPVKNKKVSKKDKPIVDEKVEELKSTELTITDATWNTKSVGDGKYRLKVVATDKYARPTDPKNGEYITGEFVVDNTPPEIVAIPDQIIGWKMIERMIVEDKTSPIIGGRFRIDNLPWVAITPDFSSFGTKRVNILLTTPNGPVDKLPKGNHTVQVQAEDAAGNKLDRTFRIEPKTKSTIFTNANGTKTSKDPDSKELIELMMYPIDNKK
ncbi:MAG: SpoIVB peptidase S55 domain-containing protein [bacterium]